MTRLLLIAVTVLVLGLVAYQVFVAPGDAPVATETAAAEDTAPAAEATADDTATAATEEAATEEAAPTETAEAPPEEAAPDGPFVFDAAKDYGLVIDVAGEASGQIVIDLFEDIAPQHAEQITKIAAAGGYDNVVFHRVIDGFMAQTGDVENGILGGDLSRAGTGGSDFPDIPAEFSDRPFDRGIVGMARAQNPNSANSQFFIMFQEGYFLNGQYTVIGEVTAGMEIVDQIKRGTGPNGAVVGEPDRMASVSVTE